MQEQLTAITAEASAGIDAIQTRPELEAFKAKFMGPKGSFTDARKLIGTAPKEERPALGQAINKTKTELEALFHAANERIELAEIAERLGPAIDPTLPSPDLAPGTRHLISQVTAEITDIFARVGFTVAEGPEIETEWHCFDALNIPGDHPARDMQDTYFLPDDVRYSHIEGKQEHGRNVLRTHTSPVQIRTMLSEKPPLRIVSPGRCFRRDTVDATHSANFHQIEGLYVDKDVSVKDLKAILDYFVQTIFGKGAETRLRPSFFPFTEPSFEMDFRSPNMGKLSNQWIEIMGCGTVDPAVFESVGIDPEAWSGYAFGMGIERIAMLVYGVDDIRHFYANDVRFLRQFA